MFNKNSKKITTSIITTTTIMTLFVFLAVPNATNVNAMPINDGLIAHYTFNESNLGLDSSGNEYHGLNHGAASLYSDHTDSNVAFFDGNDKITVDGLRNYDWDDAISVSVWFNRTGESGNYQGIVNNGYYANGSWEVRMGREDGGTMIGGGVVTESHNEAWDAVSLTASQNEWHHVVMTYDGGEFLFYLDNVLQTTSDNDSGPLLIKDTPLTIGQAGIGKAHEYFYGYIDEVRVYDFAISKEMINQLYSNPEDDLTACESGSFFDESVNECVFYSTVIDKYKQTITDQEQEITRLSEELEKCKEFLRSLISIISAELEPNQTE